MKISIIYSRLKKEIFKLSKKFTLRKIISKIINFIQFYLFYSELKVNFFLFLKNFGLFNSDKFNKPIFLYDLRDSPLTFDFGDALLLANIWLNKLGFDKCQCVIYANKKDFALMTYKSYNSHFTKDEYWRRVDNIVKPLANSANFVTDIKIVSNIKILKKILKESFVVYPPHYFFSQKYNLTLTGVPLDRVSRFIRKKQEIFSYVSFLEPNLNAIESVKNTLKITNEEKIVTFTVRDYKFDAIRNTNYKFVINLYNFFKKKGYRFIVIPDHKNPRPDLGLDIYPDATIDTEKRIAIYNIAKINIGTAGGPLWLARNMPGVNMFLTNVGLQGDHIGSYSDLRRFYGKEFKWGKQPFLEFDMHLIYGPEDNINKLVTNKRFMQILRIGDVI